jgi:hypothetical protein
MLQLSSIRPAAAEQVMRRQIEGVAIRGRRQTADIYVLPLTASNEDETPT